MAARLLLVWFIGGSLALGSQAPAKQTANAEGRRLFQAYCASCHGIEGRGNGPMAEELRKPVPDLTKYTARNSGVFPSERLRQIIDGRDVSSHGSREMPVWGDAFRVSREGLDSAAVNARIDALVKYIGAIQELAAE